MKNRFFLLLGLFTCVGGSSTDSSSDRFECLHSIPHGAYFASFDKLSTSTREPDCGSLSGSDVEVLSGIAQSSTRMMIPESVKPPLPLIAMMEHGK